ncbi:Histone-lysine N-methyltransferase setd3 [Homalodisca vitripennis]|nr:Histone-lysine N-methyltransferase setd3 [Homalodisca vitripennis]
MTRQNFIPSADGSCMVNALIPLWDMANHSNGKISTDYSLGTDRSECLAWRDFNAGEQVFIFYGARSNADLLVHNGFVYPDNLHDSFRVRLGVAKSDPLATERGRVLARLALPTAADFVLLRGPQPVEGQLLAFLRIFSMQQEHLEHWAESDKVSDLTYTDCSLDTQVETKAWTFLMARIKLLQSLYPTTLQGYRPPSWCQTKHSAVQYASSCSCTESRDRLCQLFCDAKGVILVDFLERRSTINAERYFLYDFDWEVFYHPPYIPDLALSDYHFFLAMKTWLTNTAL